jgi:ribosomal protein S18 acetylase RimI-like enzyme
MSKVRAVYWLWCRRAFLSFSVQALCQSILVKIPPVVIRLTPADAERYVHLRERMLTLAPWAFSANVEDDEALEIFHLAELLAQEHYATFAIEAESPPRHRDLNASEMDARPRLLASASLTRGKPPKFAHRARLWGVFAEPEFRGRALGKALMQAVLAQARAWGGVEFLDLGVSANSPEAQRLYQSVGFAVWGREPEATEHEGCRYDELHMTLRLRA